MAEALLSKVSDKLLAPHYAFSWAQAEVLFCKNQIPQAIEMWQLSLNQDPAYMREKNEIEERIKNAK